MTKNEFINQFANIVVPKYDTEKVLPSLIIAQAILESGWGTSELSKKANNYFGLNNYHDSVTSKYGVYVMVAPQEYNGNIVYNKEEFCIFKDIAECVNCLFDWYKRPKYANLHKIVNYKDACYFVKECGYATASHYPTSLIRIIEEYNLMKYDEIVLEKTKLTPVPMPTKELYYIQCGAFKEKRYAIKRKNALAEYSIPALIKYDGEYYRVQCGCYTNYDNALTQTNKIKSYGFDCFIANNINGKEV